MAERCNAGLSPRARRVSTVYRPATSGGYRLAQTARATRRCPSFTPRPGAIHQARRRQPRPPCQRRMRPERVALGPRSADAARHHRYLALLRAGAALAAARMAGRVDAAAWPCGSSCATGYRTRDFAADGGGAGELGCRTMPAVELAAQRHVSTLPMSPRVRENPRRHTSKPHLTHIDCVLAAPQIACRNRKTNSAPRNSPRRRSRSRAVVGAARGWRASSRACEKRKPGRSRAGVRPNRLESGPPPRQ